MNNQESLPVGTKIKITINHGNGLIDSFKWPLLYETSSGYVCLDPNCESMALGMVVGEFFPKLSKTTVSIPW